MLAIFNSLATSELVNEPCSHIIKDMLQFKFSKDIQKLNAHVELCETKISMGYQTTGMLQIKKSQAEDGKTSKTETVFKARQSTYSNRYIP
jgi:hypothetical protein